jgi:hypothetical protein
MSEEQQGKGPDAGAVILGIFFLLFGTCLLLVGGGCTILWIMMLAGASNGLEEIGLLLLSIGVAVAGIFSILFAIRLFRGPRRATPTVDPRA